MFPATPGISMPQIQTYTLKQQINCLLELGGSNRVIDGCMLDFYVFFFAFYVCRISHEILCNMHSTAQTACMSAFFFLPSKILPLYQQMNGLSLKEKFLVFLLSQFVFSSFVVFQLFVFFSFSIINFSNNINISIF